MRFGYFMGYIVTANEDGSIPLSAKMICKLDESGDNALSTEQIVLLNLMLKSASVREADFDESLRAATSIKVSKRNPLTGNES